ITRPGQPKENVELKLQVHIDWKAAGPLPFRVRVFDPAGQLVEELLQATIPDASADGWHHDFPLGPLATPGKWLVKIDWLFLGKSEDHAAEIPLTKPGELASVPRETVSLSFDDDKRIAGLFAGKPLDPPYDKLNWDARRVFGLDPKKFAVFGPTQ